MRHSYKLNGPTTVIVEASFTAISEYNLSTFEGEQFDTIENVISIVDDGRAHTFETCRSIEAWRRGDANAGRMTLVIENRYLERVHIKERDHG